MWQNDKHIRMSCEEVDSWSKLSLNVEIKSRRDCGRERGTSDEDEGWDCAQIAPVTKNPEVDLRTDKFSFL